MSPVKCDDYSVNRRTERCSAAKCDACGGRAINDGKYFFCLSCGLEIEISEI